MRGYTSSPAITHVTAGDAFSAPLLPPHTPLPANRQTAIQQNHTFCPAKAYLSQGKTIRLTTQNHTFRKHAIRTRHCEASTTGTQGRLTEARKRKQRRGQTTTIIYHSTLYRSKKKSLRLGHTEFAILPSHTLRCSTELTPERTFSLCLSGNASPQSQNLFIT